jgi:membrane fusion protein (multidrug efflux system)
VRIILHQRSPIHILETSTTHSGISRPDLRGASELMTKRAVIIPFIILCFAAALLFTIKGCWTSWEGESASQRTDDAYVRADVTPLSTRISGTVRKVDVDDFEAVQAGQLLVQLDDDDYRAILGEAQAALAGARAQLDNNQAAKRIQDTQIQGAEAGITQAIAAVNAAKAGVSAVQSDVGRTTSERKRQDALLAVKATTHQQVEQAIADADRFSGMLASHQADLERAQAALTSSRTLLEAAKRQRAALDTRDALYRADIQAKQAAIIVANVNLGYTRIIAPTAGAIGERHVQAGQLVAPGMQVVDLVKGDVWIQANYKETQLTNIRKGDPADITIDSFPGIVLHGRVAEIAPASGSQFALLPPDNATGNFTKVVQRIPVKIRLDPGHPLTDILRPGFSAVVTIHASGKHAKEGPQS